MVMSSFICGSSNFPQEEGEEKQWSSLPSTPRKTCSPKNGFYKKNSFCRKSSNGKKDSNNPYSTHGLDKFSELLAELEEKRQKIYSQVDSKDVSFVRFVYSNDNDCIPIVVKSKDNQTEQDKEEEKNKKKKKKPDKNLEIPDHKVRAEPAVTASVEEGKQTKLKLEPREVEKRGLKWSTIFGLQKWRRPSSCLPVATVLILVFLALFGRSFAVLCTTLAWYILPTLTSSDSKGPTKNKKKEVCVRRFSENKMASDGLSSPKNNSSGDVKDKLSLLEHGHRRSW